MCTLLSPPSAAALSLTNLSSSAFCSFCHQSSSAVSQSVSQQPTQVIITIITIIITIIIITIIIIIIIITIIIIIILDTTLHALALPTTALCPLFCVPLLVYSPLPAYRQTFDASPRSPASWPAATFYTPAELLGQKAQLLWHDQALALLRRGCAHQLRNSNVVMTTTTTTTTTTIGTSKKIPRKCKQAQGTGAWRHNRPLVTMHD